MPTTVRQLPPVFITPRLWPRAESGASKVDDAGSTFKLLSIFGLCDSSIVHKPVDFIVAARYLSLYCTEMLLGFMQYINLADSSLPKTFLDTMEIEAPFEKPLCFSKSFCWRTCYPDVSCFTPPLHRLRGSRLQKLSWPRVLVSS